MTEKKSVKNLFEMSHEEAQELIKKKSANEGFLISQIQFSRFSKHCLQCKECFQKAKEAELIP